MRLRIVRFYRVGYKVDMSRFRILWRFCLVFGVVKGILSVLVSRRVVADAVFMVWC